MERSKDVGVEGRWARQRARGVGRGRLPCIGMAGGGREHRKAGEAKVCKALRPG